MTRVRFANLVLAGLLVIQWACVAVRDVEGANPPANPPTTSTGSQPPATSSAGNPPLKLAAVIAAPDERNALTRAARVMLDEAAGDRIATRIYLAPRQVDPTGTFRFDESALRSHIARNAPTRQKGCLFVVDLERDYFKALRSGDQAMIDKTVDLFVNAIRTANEARPGEPVMVYGIPNRTWRNHDLKMFDRVFARVDYINVNAYAGADKTDVRFQNRLDLNVGISREIAERFDLDMVAHVNPRYEDRTRVPMDVFVKGMQHLKSLGIEHVVYWQVPWNRVENLTDDGKPLSMSDAEWQAAVEQCYICALLQVFDPENAVSKSCSTTLPTQTD